jgi:hypothetical protein
MIAFAAEALSIGARYWKQIALFVLFFGGALLAIHYLENRGAERALQQIDQQDRSAVDAAEQARSKRYECTGPGSDPRNMWDQSRGLCVRP